MSIYTLGNTTAPSYGANDTSQYTEIAPTGFLALTGDYYVTDLWGYFGATSGSISAVLVLVGSGGSLLAQSAEFGVSGQTWQHGTCTPRYFSGTNNIGVGWWVTGEVHFSVYGSGQWQAGSPSSPSGTSGFVIPGGSYFQGGTGYYIQYIDPLSVSGISPASADVNTSVTISGAGFVGGSISSITFGGIAASGWTVNSDTSITVTVPGSAPAGAQTVTVNSDHGTGSTTLTIYYPPSISGISPTSGDVGVTTVTITGANFTNVSAVSFNGTGVSFTVNSSTQITTGVIPAGASTGPIYVSTPGGTASSSTFTVIGAPTISGMSPTGGAVGTAVTLTGTGFTNTSSVTLAGVACSYTVVSDTEITTSVPQGATTGVFTITTPAGSVNSPTFIVFAVYVYDGSAWQASTVYVYDGSAWQVAQVMIYDGSAWQNAV